MPASLLNLMVTTDHAVPIQTYGGTAVVQNASGDTLYYADNSQVSAASNQGTIPGGGTTPFKSPVWLRSAGLSTVRVMSVATTSLPVNIFSRSVQILGNSFNAHSTSAIFASDFLLNPQDGFYYILYCDTNGYGLARSTSPTGLFTDQGYLPGAPAYTGVPQCRLILTPGGKWSFYYITTSTGGVPGLYQTAAGAAINSTYTLTNAALLTVGAGFDANRCSEVFVFVDQAGTWRMLYMGMNSGVTAEQIGMATASAPEGPWTKVGTTPIIANGGAGAFDNGIVSDPIVIYYNSVYYIFYCAGGPNSVTGSACTSLALATTTDWSTFTKRGVVLPQATIGSLVGGGVVPGDASATGWSGQFWWPGKLATDNSCALPSSSTPVIYYTHYGRHDTAAATGNKVQSYQATFDPQSIFTGTALAGSPWTRVEAESADGKLTTSGTWTVTTTGGVWNRGWSGTGFIFSVTAGDFQMLSWTGTRARVCMVEASNVGIMNIILDGAQVATYDGCYDNGAEPTVNPGVAMAYDTGELLPGPHTLKVQLSGLKNVNSTGIGIDIDYWEYV